MIRILNEQEIQQVLTMAAGTDEAYRHMDQTSWIRAARTGQILFYGAFENNMLVGFSAFDQAGRIQMCYVYPTWRGRGIEQQLASPDKKKHTGLIIGLIIGGVVALLAIIALTVVTWFGIRYYEDTRTYHYDYGIGSDNHDDNDYYDDNDDYYDGLDDYDDDTDYYGDDDEPYDLFEGQEHSIDQIKEHVSDTLSYSINDDNYERSNLDGETSLNFDVDYPVINGLDDGAEEKVNQALKGQAMYMVDFLYEDPSEEESSYQESVLDTYGYLILQSDVEYKVTYANENFMSVVFEDFYCLGSEDASCMDI